VTNDPGAEHGGPVLHLRGPVLVGPQDRRDEAWVIGGRITFDRPRSAGEDGQTIEGFVLPGLVDAHCHVGLDAHGAVDAETSREQATADRDAGTLLIRDAGSAADTRWVDDEPDLPRIVRAGRHIARPRRYIRNFAAEVEPHELAEEVRRQARAGDGWVKLVGDWIDRDLGDLAPCWPREALDAAMRVAHEEGARVTAHCFGEDCLPDLLDAGIDCIEHGTGLTRDTVLECASRGVPVVPTLVNIATFPTIAAGGEAKFPRYAAHMRDLHARRYATVRSAVEEGVPVYCGTDAGGSLPHGLVAQEVAELVAAGLPAVDALSAACWAARRWLGRPALEEGAPADLVVYPDDPREDVGVLAAPSAVVLRGAVLAGTAAASGGGR
jgi:imidazolonepropionase-like amidohydrolase